mmetsp:Transcript_7800/g.18223  ORF Transcript_7800/g.18223 Transcript_7800/m.18223 type:complete len:253 (-) Transcript_7800:771-1529(-)
MERPSSTAATMVAKLSSASTMSDASLATSVPAMPMATPMAACLSAGASLTPSPVMAVTSPLSLRILISACLSRGSVREKTIDLEWLVSSALRFSSGSAKKSAPVKERSATGSSASRMPISRAIASAVGLVSPVIITTRMPAVAHEAMAGFTSGLAGSLMPQRPTKTISRSRRTRLDRSVSCAFAGCDGPSYSAKSPTSSRIAMASTRSGRDAMAFTRPSTSARCASVIGTVEPSARRACVQRASTDSGAPLQ